jgi:xanthine dehydrogenase molybdenum-binding subunit
VTWKEVIGLRTIIGEGRFDFDHTLSNCMMSFVEVEVDTDTGKWSCCGWSMPPTPAKT